MRLCEMKHDWNSCQLKIVHQGILQQTIRGHIYITKVMG